MLTVWGWVSHYLLQIKNTIQKDFLLWLLKLKMFFQPPFLFPSFLPLDSVFSLQFFDYK